MAETDLSNAEGILREIIRLRDAVRTMDEDEFRLRSKAAWDAGRTLVGMPKVRPAKRQE